MKLLSNRKKAFSSWLLRGAGDKIRLIDVGSGGPLKAPWSDIDIRYIEKLDFEPTAALKGNLPLCISDKQGFANFFIADDERASSLHLPNMEFVNRFAQIGMQLKETIKVEINTLDDIFKHSLEEIDALDINVEGHDFNVLTGCKALLQDRFIKLVKIEFELTNAWIDNGRFGDIERFMQALEYDLADIEIEYLRPANVLDIHTRGEPVWGKALFTPSIGLWKKILDSENIDTKNNQVRKGLTLYCSANMPGRAFDLLDISSFDNEAIQSTKKKIKYIFAFSRIERLINLTINKLFVR